MTTKLKQAAAAIMAVAPKATATTAMFCEQADEYAVLKEKLAMHEEELAPLRERVAELESGLLSVTDELVDAAKPVSLYGERYMLDVSAKGRSVINTDKDLLKDLLGDDLFYALAKFNVTDLKKYLTGEQTEAVLEYGNTSKRRIKIKTLKAD